MSHNWRNYRKKLKKGDHKSIITYFTTPVKVSVDVDVPSDHTELPVQSDHVVVPPETGHVEVVQSDHDDAEVPCLSLNSDPVESSVQSDNVLVPSQTTQSEMSVQSCPVEVQSDHVESEVSSPSACGSEMFYAVPLHLVEEGACYDQYPVNSVFQTKQTKRKFDSSSESDARKFSRGKYESKFQWLYFSQFKKGFMCKYCELFSVPEDGSTPYVTCGAVFDSHPTRRLDVHERSRKHKESVEKYMIAKSGPVIAMLQPRNVATQTQVPRNRRYLKKIFKACGFLIQKNWAHSNLADLVKFIGRTCDPEILEIQSEDVTYLSSMSVTEIITVLSDFIQQKLLTDLKECGKFTLLADESTDTSNRTQLSIFARWVRKTGSCEHFMGLVNVERTTSLALMEAIDIFCHDKGIELKNVRWLSHLHACTRFINRFECLLDTIDSLIDETHEPELTGIRNNMLKRQFVATTLILADMLRPVNYLSLYLQEDCGTFTELPVRVKQCTDDLHLIINKYERNILQDLEFSKCQRMFDVITDRTPLARRHRGHLEISPEDYLRDTGIPLVYSLLAEVEDAFSIHSPVLAAFSYLDPKNLPNDVQDLVDYGNDKATVLAEFYGNEKVDEYQGQRNIAAPDYGNAANLLNVLKAFRHQLYIYKQRGHGTLLAVYQQLANDQMMRACFPGVFEFYRLALLIPQSTAVVERGFSLMNTIATDLRTMGQITLDSLMRISSYQEIAGPEQMLTEHDMDLLVDMFKHKKNREMPL